MPIFLIKVEEKSFQTYGKLDEFLEDVEFLGDVVLENEEIISEKIISIQCTKCNCFQGKEDPNCNCHCHSKNR